MNTPCKSVFHHPILVSVVLAAAAATSGCQSDDSTSPITHVPDASSDHTSPGAEAGADAGHQDAGTLEAAPGDAEAPDARDATAD